MVRTFNKNPMLFKTDKARKEAAIYAKQDAEEKKAMIAQQLAEIDSQLVALDGGV